MFSFKSSRQTTNKSYFERLLLRTQRISGKLTLNRANVEMWFSFFSLVLFRSWWRKTNETWGCIERHVCFTFIYYYIVTTIPIVPHLWCPNRKLAKNIFVQYKYAHKNTNWELLSHSFSPHWCRSTRAKKKIANAPFMERKYEYNVPGNRWMMAKRKSLEFEPK